MVARIYGWNYSKRYFDRLLWLSSSGWAWEFRRRLPTLLGESRASRTNRVSLKRPDGSDLVRLSAPCRLAERHGLHYLPDPRLSAYETPVFWLPEVMTVNIDAAAALRDQATHSPEQMLWQDIPGKKSLLLVPGRRTKLVITARSYAAQLAIDKAETPLPLAIYPTLRMQKGPQMLNRLRCLDWFVHHCAGIEFDRAPRRGFAPLKLRAALIALDGWLSGASQREIAAVIFNKEDVDSDWNSHVHSLKSRTRRLIKKGRDLMQKDYLKLL